MSWVIGGIFAFLVVRFFWRSYIHPSNVMGRQAANMNWVAAGRTDNPSGGKDVLLKREGCVSKIDWRTGEVWLVEPSVNKPFKDYIELERWLTLKEMEHRDLEDTYIREKQAFLDMAMAQEKELGEATKRGGDIEDEALSPELQKLQDFDNEVRRRLRDGQGGDELEKVDSTFRLTSPEYLHITHVLFQTAINLGKSPTEVATILIMAFGAAAEAQDALQPVTRVVVYLRTAIDYMRGTEGVFAD